MPWPMSQDYNEAIQTPAACFNDPELKAGQPVCNAMGLPQPCSGNFADVYALQAPRQKWAIKCFTREIPGIRERYVEISKYLAQQQLPFMVEFKFLDQGIRVRGQWYPVLKMHWVEGFTLNHFVKQQLGSPATLGLLSQMWVKMATRLREGRLAHCDLQHGNVMLVPGTKAGMLSLRLVDYDGMCVPALELLKSIEVGHPNFQHPQRLRERIYSIEVDRFSHLVIYTALKALSVAGQGLWQRFDNGDNLLFKQADFANPPQSALFRELQGLRDAEVRRLTDTLAEAVKKPLEQTPHLEQLVGEPGGVSPRRSAPTGGGTVQAPQRTPRKSGGSSKAALVGGIVCVAVLALGAAAFFMMGGEENKPTSSAIAKGPTAGQVPASPTQPILTKEETKSHPLAPKTEPKVETKVEPKVETKVEPKVETKVEPKVETKVEPKLPSLQEVIAKEVWAAVRADESVILPLKEGSQISNFGRPHLWGPIPGWLDSASFLARQKPTAVTTFKVEGSGLVLMAVSERWRGGGNLDGGWYEETKGRDALLREGWQDGATAISTSDVKMLLFWRLARTGENFRIRTEKYIAPILIVGKGAASDPPPVTTKLDPKTEPPTNIVYLADLPEIDPKVGHGKFSKGRQEFGKNFPLTIKGKPSPKGLSMHPPTRGMASVGYALGKKYQTFTGAVAINDSGSNPRSPITFQVMGDGKLLWKSAPLQKAGESEPFTVPMKGVDRLELQVHCPGNYTDAHAVWVEPHLKAPPTLVEKRDLLPVPDADDLAKADKLIKQLYQADYAKRTAADKLALAQKLLEQGRQTMDPVARFICYREARDLAAAAPDPALAVSAVDQLAAEFSVDALDWKEKALEAAGRAPSTPASNQALYDTAGALVEQALARDNYDQAISLAKIAHSGAIRTKMQALVVAANAHIREVEALKREFSPVQAALKTLETMADDPDANLQVGRYRIVQQGNYDVGLPLLVKGGDAKLKELAAKDLAGAQEPKEQMAIGDAWYELAEGESGRAKKHLQQRAGFWYQQALAGLTGLDQAKVEQRLKGMEPARPAELVFLASLAELDAKMGPWKFGKGTTGSPNNTPIRVAGVASPRGLGMHPAADGSSSVQYKLGKTALAFRASVALDDSSNGSATPIVFAVLGDGKPLWTSQPIRNSRAAQFCNINVTGVDVLELRVVCPGRAEGAHAVWYEPNILRTPASAAATTPASDKDWLVIFRSSNPAIWNSDVKTAADFAMTLDKAPANVRYLRISRGTDFVIISMTRDRLNRVSDDGKFGFEGTAHEGSGARHLGVYSASFSARAKGSISVRVLPWYSGWGFGHKAFINDSQGFCWDGVEVAPCVFEIALKTGNLTAAETKKLLGQ